MKKILWGLPLMLAVLGCEMAGLPGPSGSGAELYADYCASCHGADARGGAPEAGRTPPDLTTLAVRHDGRFPMTYAMSTIDGYARDDTHGPMPRFGDLIESRTVTWVDETGTPTPTPEALLRLANYLEGVQVEG